MGWILTEVLNPTDFFPDFLEEEVVVLEVSSSSSSESEDEVENDKSDAELVRTSPGGESSSTTAAFLEDNEVSCC